MNNIIHIIQHTARTATVLLLALLTAQTAGAQSSFSGGSGTEADPYKISSSADLVQLATDINNSTSRLYEDQYFVQTGNINMSGINFVPIGINDDNNHRFRGKYNGQNYTISNLTVNGSYDDAGLFGYIYNGDIDNVRLVSPSITNTKNSYTGALVGFGNMPGIHHCVVINPTLSGGNSIGVFAGGQYAGNIQYTYYTGNNNYSNVGNTIGSNANTSIGRAYTLTLGDGITTSTAPAFTYGGTDYYAGTITLAAAPTGWNYAYSVNGSAISGNTFDISADATVAVTRTPIDYTITYNLGGGTNASGNPATYTIQSATITLAAPTRTGYTFGGWYANSGLTGNQVTTIGGGSTGNVELWAKWTPTQYTITYNLGGGTNHGDNPSTYTIESAVIALGAATRTGYQFGGWYASADFGGDAVTTIASGSTGDVELWAKWTANRYAIAFNRNGATDGQMDNEAFDYDEAKALTACAYTRTGYHFTGWNTEADGSGTAYADGETVQNITAEHNATVTLYAQWEANTYTVHFEPVIPVYGTMADMTLTYDQPATALTKNVFYTTTGEWQGWNTEADGSGTNYEDEALVQNLTAEDGGVVTLYAQWRLQHRFNYDNTIFRCYNVGNSNQVYWAYAGETVKVEVIDGTSEYTIRVVNGDGEDITLNTETNTFVMPDEEVWITYTSVKRMSYTTISLDNFESGDDVVYLYDASQPTVTPTVVVKDGETVLTEGTDYTLAITNNTGSPTQMVTATVTVTGMGGYVGTNTREFRITPFNIANCEIKGTLEAYDNGYGVYYPLERNVEVWNGDTQLEAGTDYSLDVESADSYEVGQFYNATVKGLGDWGGSKTFQFKVVELHHTVVFVANGGSGTMASDVVANDGGFAGHYTLPACGFTAPDGKVFDHWEASCEPDAEKQPGDYFTAPYIWSESDVQTITVTAYWRDALILLDDDSAQPEGNKNGDIIAANSGMTDLTVQLAGRTLYKDGSWNTLCLPFSLTAEQIGAHEHFAGATLMELDTDGKNGFDTADGTLYLTFKKATAIAAGVPYLVKWDAAGDDFTSPVFSGVTIDASASTTVTGTYVGLEEVQMVGTYSSVPVTADDKSILFLGDQNTLYYSTIDRNIRSFRAYFSVPYIKGYPGTAQVRAFRLDFSGDEATGIISVQGSGLMVNDSDAWYTLDGRRLDGKPVQKGMYINGGKKVVIK